MCVQCIVCAAVHSIAIDTYTCARKVLEAYCACKRCVFTFVLITLLYTHELLACIKSNSLFAVDFNITLHSRKIKVKCGERIAGKNDAKQKISK